MYLLDTDAISVLRRGDRHREAVYWLSAQQASDLFLSVVTVGEIERGIGRQTRRNPPFAQDLAAWLAGILTWYGDRVLPVDVPTARRWGRLCADLGHNSYDLLIAATALERGLTVVTRNTRHFEPTGVPVINPFGPPDTGGSAQGQADA